MKQRITLFLIGALLVTTCTACGAFQSGPQGTETDSVVETETEELVEIVDANDILTQAWDQFEDQDTDGDWYNNKFDLMGGHFTDAVIGAPAVYDLTQLTDLELTYCVPQTAAAELDDAATMVHLMKASSFTAGAYHVLVAANTAAVAEAIKQQILGNHWLDGFPDSYFIGTIDEQYVVAAVGDAAVIDYFASFLKDIYGKQLQVQVLEAVR